MFNAQEGKQMAAKRERYNFWKDQATVEAAIATKLQADNALLRQLLQKALTRSAIVHPGFADEIRAALAK